VSLEYFFIDRDQQLTSSKSYTSGLPTPSRTLAGEATPTNAANPTSSGARASTAGAAQAVQTGAIGMGALLGAAAVYFM
jgi:hypothetical protein